MAAGATIHTFAVQLADVDRGVYDDFTLRVALHPSETMPYMVTRLLAYCLEFEEGIAFSEGISSTDEPAVLVRDLTGAVTAWIEVGAPDAARLHFGSKLAGRVAVYTHRDPAKVAAPWAGKRIHNSNEIVFRSFDASFIEDAVAAVERRNSMTLSVTEGQLYLEMNGTTLTTELHAHEVH
ncbi:YaeQ family protein [Salinibacterium sp. UTAS2018]|uniref:YaeQ family protein n=1 Tax=unclassified Salinibacterium TaxID=2632331 RepID=UPI001009702A|nr:MULTISPECIES: YaeQ family protein [unclassified Salinibacterium]MBH0007747.1 YaeQ family protein [Salinibacterium sp. SWN1162]QAV70903.1 YaeQ family protein [Salinibacterium sp. UTAS2018]